MEPIMHGPEGDEARALTQKEVTLQRLDTTILVVETVLRASIDQLGNTEDAETRELIYLSSEAIAHTLRILERTKEKLEEKE